MDGQPMDRLRHDDLPPRPGAPARRRPSFRENVDRELGRRSDREIRSAMVAAVADLRARPTEAWDDLARAASRPAGKLPDRTFEAARSGANRDRYKAEVLAGVARMIDAEFDAAA